MTNRHNFENDYVLLGEVSDIGAKGRKAKAVWISDGRISKVGGRELATFARKNGIPIEDYGDSFLSPGFIDPHVHLEASAIANATSVDLRYPTYASITEVLSRLEKVASTLAQGEWLIAQANLFWNEKLDERRFPSRAELDKACPNNPVAIRAGGHVSILNSLALQKAGVESYQTPSGMMGRAVIERDEAGQATGMIAELDALLPLPELDGSYLEKVIESSLFNQFTRFGVTTIGEIVESTRGARITRRLANEGRLSSRVGQYLWVPGAFSLGDITDFIADSEDAFADAFVAGIKIFADGGYSSRNAAVLTPYLDGSSTEDARGDLNLSQDEIIEALEVAIRHEIQLLVHTNGERAQRHALAALLAYERAKGKLRSGTMRLEHFSNLLSTDETLEDFIASSADFVGQPTFIYTFSALLERILGSMVQGGRQPYRRLIDRGLLPAAASDIHMGAEPQQSNPLFGIWAATARKSFLDTPVDPDQAISPREGMEMYTLSAARAMRLDHEIGSIEAGKRADIAVLDADPTRMSPEEIREVQAVQVWRDGIPRLNV